MRRMRLALLALLLGGWFIVAPLSAATAAPAAQDQSFLNCTGWDHTTFSPPLTNTLTLTNITVDDRYGNQILPTDPVGSCLGTSTIVGGFHFATATVVRSCQMFSAPGAESGTVTITWVHLDNSTSSSTMEVSRTVERVNGNTVVTYTGTVTSGDFVGESVIETFVAPNTAFTACSTTGLSALTFQIQITIG